MKAIDMPGPLLMEAIEQGAFDDEPPYEWNGVTAVGVDARMAREAAADGCVCVDCGGPYVMGLGFLHNYCRGPWSDAPKPAYRKARISNALRKRVYERDAYRCVSCGDWHNLTCDHVVPESAGGATTFENLQTMCAPCNGRKGARHAD